METRHSEIVVQLLTLFPRVSPNRIIILAFETTINSILERVSVHFEKLFRLNETRVSYRLAVGYYFYEHRNGPITIVHARAPYIFLRYITKLKIMKKKSISANKIYLLIFKLIVHSNVSFRNLILLQTDTSRNISKVGNYKQLSSIDRQ